MNPLHLKKLIESTVGIALHGCSPEKSGGWRVDYKDGTTQAQRDQGDAIARTFNPTPREREDWEQSERRQLARFLFTDPGPQGIMARALLRAAGKTLAQVRDDIEAGNCD